MLRNKEKHILIYERGPSGLLKDVHNEIISHSVPLTPSKIHIFAR